MVRPTGELWPGQAAEDAAREAALAQGAPPPGGYRPSAYQDQYLVGASLEPFVHPLAGARGGAAQARRSGPASTTAGAPRAADTGGAGETVLVDRRVVDLGAGAEGRGVAVDLTADSFDDGPSFARPGHTPVAGSIFAAPDQHAATGSLFVRPEPAAGSGILPPAGSRPAPLDHTAFGAPGDAAGDRDGVGLLGDGADGADGGEPRRRGRTIALVGGLLAIVAAGAGGFAWSALGGGGPQPESALPSTTVAFVKVDLDPSADQKVDAIRFLRAFPKLRDRVDEKSDLRRTAFTALQDTGRLDGVDYARDLAPWLGQRMALGVVPSADVERPTVVLALAVTDPAAARAHVPGLASALGGRCEVQEEFAVCAMGKDGSALDSVLTATSRGSLADAATYRQDLRALGESGVVMAWADSAKAGELARTLTLPTSLPGGLLGRTGVEDAASGSSGSGDAASGSSVVGDAALDSGRTVVALRFDGPHLELAGHTTGAKGAFVGSRHVTGVTSLPWDSLAAVSVANGGDQLRAAWPDLEKALDGVLGSDRAAGATPTATRGGTEVTGGGPIASVEDALGIAVPQDVYAALGSQFTLVFGGIEERNGQPRAAVVGNGDQVVLGRLAASGRSLGAKDLTLLPSPGHSVLATSDEYGQEIVKGSGLGDMPSFKDAVPDVEDARVVGYVDIAGLVSQFRDQMDPKDVAELANLSALGVTVSGEGHDADFRVRLTTK